MRYPATAHLLHQRNGSTANRPPVAAFLPGKPGRKLRNAKELRKRLGVQRGSRIRFSIPANGSIKIEPVLYDLDDLWRMADQGGKPGNVMTFEEMNAAKAGSHW